MKGELKIKNITKALIVFFLISFEYSAAASKINLAGQWSVKLDPNSKGVADNWFAETLTESVTIKLPGSIQQQGLGEIPSAKTKWTTGIGQELLADKRFNDYINGDEFKSPFWLTPARHYVGSVWYQRTVLIPSDWINKRISLILERPHWQTTVWVDEKIAGSQDSLGTSHEYDLTDLMTAGTDHRLTIMVNNEVVVPVGLDAHSVSDQTQSNWNGIVGEIALCKSDKLWIKNVQVYPEIADEVIKVDLQIGNDTHSQQQVTLELQAEFKGKSLSKELHKELIPVGGKVIKTNYPVNDPVLWSEFSPVLYQLKISVANRDYKHEKQVAFGMREIGISGTQFTINNQKIFLRGTLECCIFPETGYPPTDIDAWKKILTVCQSFGLNHVRFHSWCPPEAAFDAADRMGMYFQVDSSAWSAFGSGGPLDTWTYQETDRMLKAYGNHPSFILLTPSNEPGGNTEKRDKFLNQWVRHYRARDTRRYYTAGSGWPIIEANNYHVISDPRMHNYVGQRPKDRPQTSSDYREFIAAQTVPVISHEIGQWCAYPNFAETSKYSGFLKADNIAVFEDMLNKAGLGYLGRDYLMASGHFQALLYKEEIEAALRTPGMAGFQLLDLHDFPGQGTAPVGVLDAYWQPKGYITAEQYRCFCDDNVLIARLDKMVFTSDEFFQTNIEQANYGPGDLEECKLNWNIYNKQQLVTSGQLFKKEVPTGGLSSFGTISADLSGITKAAKLTLVVENQDSGLANNWSFWVYPADLETDDGSVIISRQLDELTETALNNGQTVLLIPDIADIKADTYGSFSPIFWNRITFPSQKEHTLGVLCDPEHPALDDFPTDYYTNWQWWELLQFSKPLELAPLGVKPIVRVIDDWAMCRDLGLIFEAKIHKGKVLVCSMDIINDLDERPVAKQLKYSLLKYMQSDKFSPSIEVSLDLIKSMYLENIESQ